MATTIATDLEKLASNKPTSDGVSPNKLSTDMILQRGKRLYMCVGGSDAINLQFVVVLLATVAGQDTDVAGAISDDTITTAVMLPTKTHLLIQRIGYSSGDGYKSTTTKYDENSEWEAVSATLTGSGIVDRTFVGIEIKDDKKVTEDTINMIRFCGTAHAMAETPGTIVVTPSA